MSYSRIGNIVLIFVLVLMIIGLGFLIGKLERTKDVQAQAMIRLNPGNTLSWQDHYGICRTLINAGTQPAYMVPTRTAEEWVAALKGLHNLGVSLKLCEQFIRRCSCCNCPGGHHRTHNPGPPDVPVS